MGQDSVGGSLRVQQHANERVLWLDIYLPVPRLQALAHWNYTGALPLSLGPVTVRCLDYYPYCRATPCHVEYPCAPIKCHLANPLMRTTALRTRGTPPLCPRRNRSSRAHCQRPSPLLTRHASPAQLPIYMVHTHNTQICAGIGYN